jgi:hypothetical protein
LLNRNSINKTDSFATTSIIPGGPKTRCLEMPQRT